LIALGGARLALVCVGVFLPLTALVVGGNLRRVDRDADVPVVEIGLLRSLPLFSALPAPELESVARSLVPVEVAEGEDVIVQGDVGDRFYVVAEGRIEAKENGRLVNTHERGAGFGEIALLHDVLRTATCTAVEPSRLYALERDDFLTAVTGHVRATDEAHRLAAERIAELDGFSGA
jgi:CRP-like cAMP-binding protein